MGRGCGKGQGKGAAQLGKAVKGKSKERTKNKKTTMKETIVEKQLNEDIKMLEEYEKLNKLAEAQRIRLKKLKTQETYNTRINAKLLLNIHRKFMRQEKVASLRKEIEVMAQNHERDVDRKDAIIQMLTRDLDDAEEQFQTAQRTHMDNMQKFVNLHRSKISALEEEFERDLKALKNEFNAESKMIVEQHEREKKEMQGIISMVEAEEGERIALAKQTHETVREEIRNKNLEGINELRINLENKIEELEKQFDEAHTNYVDGTATSNRHFKELQADDNEKAEKIGKQRRRIERFQNNLTYWKKKLENNQKECALRNSTLREQKIAILKHCNALKSRMKKFRGNESKRLTELTVLSREALKKNKSKLDKAEKIFHLAELARKYETEREKVLPFYESTVTASDLKGVDTGEHHDLETFKVGAEKGPDDVSLHAQAFTADGQPIQEWDHLVNFHKKYNKVLLDKLAIQQEKQRLQKENADLRSILKQYLAGIAITEEVVDTDNPLLIVNGKVNLIDKQVRRMGRPLGVIEGHETINHYQVQRVNL